MSCSFNDIDHAIFVVEQAARGTNAKVRKRVEKVCKELKDLKRFAMNIPEPVDLFSIEMVIDYGKHPEKYRKVCAGCGKDITLSCAWVYPQEPGKYYCTDCEHKRFKKETGAED